MLFFKLSIFTLLLLVSGINAMKGRLPADIIREIVRQVDQAQNWNGSERLAALKSMSVLNKSWKAALKDDPRLNKSLFMAIAGNPYR